MNYHMHILPTCNPSVQIRWCPFLFIFQFTTTEEGTEALDLTALQYPPFAVFIFLRSKNTHLHVFYFPSQVSSTIAVEETGSRIRLSGFEYPATSRVALCHLLILVQLFTHL